MNWTNKTKNRTARFTKNILSIRPFRIVKVTIFTPWRSGVLVSRVKFCRRKTRNRSSYFKRPTIWLLRGGGEGGWGVGDLVIIFPRFFPWHTKPLYGKYSLQDFFSLEIVCRLFFCEITIPPLKVKWSISLRWLRTNRGNWELRVGQETVKSKSFSGLSRHMKTGCQWNRKSKSPRNGSKNSRTFPGSRYA